MNTTPSTLSPEICQKLDQCRTLYLGGIEQIKQAGAIVAELRDKHSMLVSDIATALNSPVGLISRLERVGRVTMHPSLLFSTIPAATSLSHLSYTEQDRLLNGHAIELVTMREDGMDVLQADVSTLTRSQVTQVFASSRIRSAEEQRKWLESRITAKTVEKLATKDAKSKAPWTINRKGNLEFPALGIEWDSAMLATLLSQMENAKKKA